jgi:aryl-alcohol dehydrogenase-like predicted oxidoreductase
LIQRLERLVLGTAGFGGIGSSRRLVGRGESEPESHGILDRAFDLGIRVLDTAVTYGDGASERFVGSWLKQKGPSVRAELVINTKVGIRGGLSRDRVIEAVDASLQRLQIDHVDTLFAHIPDPEVPWPTVLGTFAELVSAGKIRGAGVSNVSDADLTIVGAAVTADGVRFGAVQNKFNLLFRSDERAGLLTKCKHLGLRYLAYSPLAGGLLSGKYDLLGELPRGSRAALRPDIYQGGDVRAHAPAIKRLAALAGELGVSMPALALGWVLDRREVDGVILGPRSPAQLNVVEEALGLDPLPDVWREIDRLF